MPLRTASARARESSKTNSWNDAIVSLEGCNRWKKLAEMVSYNQGVHVIDGDFRIKACSEVKVGFDTEEVRKQVCWR